MNFNARENYDHAINTFKFDSSLRKMRCCKGIPAEQWRLLYFMHVVKKQYSFKKKYDEDRFKHASHVVKSYKYHHSLSEEQLATRAATVPLAKPPGARESAKDSSSSSEEPTCNFGDRY